MISANQAREERDPAALARVRKRALAFLIAYHHIDPRKVRLDDVFCIVNANRIAGSCEQKKFYITGGKVGHFTLPSFSR